MRFVRLVLLSLLVPIAATAQEGGPPRRTGFAVQGLLGLSDCLGDYCDDGTAAFEETRVGVGIAAAAWYRPLPLLGLGGGLHHNIIGTEPDIWFLGGTFSYHLAT